MAALTGKLSLLFQEILTAVVRIRAGRQQVSSSDHFRQQIRTALATVAQEAVRGGYSAAEASLATQAVVAFLDESILNSGNPMLADWFRQPIGPEYFQQHVAGEVFFGNIRDLLTGDDSPRAADLLELYQLCLLLGYRGRYGTAREGDVKMIVDRITQKIDRIRGAAPLLEPNWRPAGETAPAAADPWGRTLQWAAAGAGGLLVLALIAYWLLLRGAVNTLTVSINTTAAFGPGGVC